MAKTQKQMTADGVLIEVPVLAVRPAYDNIVRRVDLLLSGEDMYTMAAIRLELNARHATFAGGRHVESNADVVRWFLEQVKGGM